MTRSEFFAARARMEYLKHHKAAKGEYVVPDEGLTVQPKNHNGRVGRKVARIIFRHPRDESGAPTPITTKAYRSNEAKYVYGKSR